MDIQLYFDGASRGNPGSAGAGVHLILADKTVSLSEPLNIATNNQAEYAGVLLGLNYLRKHYSEVGKISSISIMGDSQLVIKQLLGEWKVKSQNIRPIYLQTKNLIDFFRSQSIYIRFKYIPRGQNSIADRLANEGADQN